MATATRANVFKAAPARRASTRRTVVVRAERTLFAKDLVVPPKHLDGSAPGDFGFDPLLLGADPATLMYPPTDQKCF